MPVSAGGGLAPERWMAAAVTGRVAVVRSTLRCRGGAPDG